MHFYRLRFLHEVLCVPEWPLALPEPDTHKGHGSCHAAMQPFFRYCTGCDGALRKWSYQRLRAQPDERPGSNLPTRPHVSDAQGAFLDPIARSNVVSSAEDQQPALFLFGGVLTATRLFALLLLGGALATRRVLRAGGRAQHGGRHPIRVLPSYTSMLAGAFA